jgi:hypothetical protein
LCISIFRLLIQSDTKLYNNIKRSYWGDHLEQKMKTICFYRFAIISQLRRCYFGINFVTVILDFYEWKQFGLTQTNMST